MDFKKILLIAVIGAIVFSAVLATYVAFASDTWQFDRSLGFTISFLTFLGSSIPFAIFAILGINLFKKFMKRSEKQ